jgi:hypothetical protein
MPTDDVDCRKCFHCTERMSFGKITQDKKVIEPTIKKYFCDRMPGGLRELKDFEICDLFII